jgi:hypothetical protein
MIAEYPPLAIYTKLAMSAISETRLEADRPLPTKPRRCKSQEKRTKTGALKAKGFFGAKVRCGMWCDIPICARADFTEARLSDSFAVSHISRASH